LQLHHLLKYQKPYLGPIENLSFLKEILSWALWIHNLVLTGFYLKKWVGWEKALASAGHVSPHTP